MSQSSAHDWFRPKLKTLLLEAEQAGYGRDVAVAVVTDLMNGAEFSTAPPVSPDGKWAQDIGEPAGQSSEMPPGFPLPDDPGDVSRVHGAATHVRRGFW